MPDLNLNDDPFTDISGCISATAIESEKRLKIAIVGSPKTGKSWFASTAPQPIMYYDFDGRAESLRDKPGLRIQTLRDITQTNPIVMKKIESDLSTFKYRFSNNKIIPATFVFDSVTYLHKYMENELFSQESKLYRGIKLGPTRTLRVRNGWDALNGVEGYLQYLITEFSQLGNVIFIFHERPEKDYVNSDPVKQLTEYTDRMTVDPQYLAKILSTFNEVYRIQLDYANNYVVTCKANSKFGASTTLLIDAEEKPNIMNLIAKHQQRLKTGGK